MALLKLFLIPYMDSSFGVSIIEILWLYWSLGQNDEFSWLIHVSIIEILWLYWSFIGTLTSATLLKSFHNRNIMALLKLIFSYLYIFVSFVSIIEILWLYWSYRFFDFFSFFFLWVSIIEILWLYWSSFKYSW